MYIDVHCHLNILENVSEIVKTMKRKKVFAVAHGTDIKSNREVLELSKKFENVASALGIYPLEALSLSDKEIDDEIEFIRENNDKIVAIGEVGLDLKNPDSNLEKQKKAFQKFIDLAKELDKPIVVHSRKAELECIEMLESSGIKKVVMHCFSGKLKLVDRIVSNGWYLSIPTCIKNTLHFGFIVERVPLENLFAETDSPYLHPDKEFPNEPGNVIESYKKISEIKKLLLAEIEKTLDNNYAKLFGKV